MSHARIDTRGKNTYLFYLNFFILFEDRSVLGLNGGISTLTFQKFLLKMMVDWQIIDVYQDRAAEAIEFQYTYWPDPDNRTARGQEFINVCCLLVAVVFLNQVEELALIV